MKGLAWLVLCALLGACSTERAAPCVERDAGTPVDPALLMFLSKARAAHHLADMREEAKDPRGALGALLELVNGSTPKSKNELMPEVREVLSDTRARMADLESQLGEFDPALADVNRGLELAAEPSYFRGHLYETLGVVQERRAKALKPTDPSGAAAAEKLAVTALEEAMRIQESVIQNAAPSASGASPKPGASARHQ